MPRSLPAQLEAYALDSGAFVALMAASLTASTAWACGLELNLPVVGLAAAATAAVYGLDRLLDQAPADAQNVPQRSAWVEQHRRALSVQVGVCALTSAVLALLLPREAQWVLLGLGVCTGIYGLRLIPRLRRWATPLKPLSIGVLWAGGSVWVPCAIAGVEPGELGWRLFAARCLHVICGCLLFDLRDLAGDAASGERSWAARLGRGGTLASCWVLTAAAAALLATSPDAWRCAPDLVTSGALGALLLAPRVDLRRYSAVGVDGALGLPGFVAAALARFAGS